MEKTTSKKLVLSEQQKKIVNIVVTVLQICIVIIAITASIIILVNPTSGDVSKASTKLLPVLTDSMDGTVKAKDVYGNKKFGDSFKVGDLLIAKEPNAKTNEANTLEVGQIITFKGIVLGQEALITHRIVKYTDIDGVRYYNTQGDNPAASQDAKVVAADEVLAIYSGKVKGAGKVINWFQQNPTNFLLVIVIPLIVLFIYNIIMFVMMLMQSKNEKLAAAAGAGTAIDEEEIKKKAIEEFLAKQKAEGGTSDAE